MKDESRYYLRPSSIASYFGVGYNTPTEQLEYDANLEEQDFTEDAEDRMSLGRHLEDSVIDYFEERLGVTITDRNTELHDLYDGKIMGKFDGIIHADDGDILVENKVSNAAKCFTDNVSYHFQIQSYLASGKFKSALLCGLWKGKPYYKWIEKDEEMIADIKEMADWVSSYLMGFEEYEDYPWHLYEKYSNKTQPKTLTVTEEAKTYFLQLGALNSAKASIEKQIKDLKKDYGDMPIDDGVYEDTNMRVSVSSYERTGNVDLHTLSLDHPKIDLEKYREDPISIQTVRVKIK